ncbi:DUF1353 domain-containing protein [Sulfitobacter pacificus]|uniref:DUF1353 domain-containing protein n=1 Tax=Sulfitobacter pacificus TaxID=1499314 RepID=A0ABQ5VGD8_9RHOB|nr:DUF1353 domain-containing protein [Sulfitobacter pacificus]GLQ26143.1 hypothetical protein GCM10007927_09460 [Sulfitobacter pacificus]
MLDFETPADWSQHLSGIKYVTTRDIDWGLGTPRSKTRLKIPAGRVFDVSVPRGLRWLIDPHNPKYRIAGLIHDELLHVHNWTRMRAGGEFHDALRAGGTSAICAIALWVAVSLFKYPLATR